MTNHTLQRGMFQAGAAFAGIAVALGAFGAHLLKKQIEPDMLSVFETGVRYQFMHGIALIALASFLRHIHEKTAFVVYRLFVIGMVLFSGSLYVLSTSSIWLSGNISGLGAFTPIGGLCFLGGWFMLAYKGYKDDEGIRHHTKRRSTEE